MTSLSKKKPQIKITRSNIRLTVTVNGKRAKKFTSSCREIYKVGDYVIKIDLSHSDEMYSNNQSMQEALSWSSIEKKDQKYFAKLLGYGICVINDETIAIYTVQKYIKRTKIKPTKKDVSILDRLSHKYGISDVHRESEEYLSKNGNWVMTKKGPVIIDYGISECNISSSYRSW